MSRELRFRAWDTLNKRMIPNEREVIKSIQFDQDGEFDSIEIAEMQEDFTWSVKTSCTIELMQSTGIHDKTGKLIYEGDIINDEWGNDYQIKYNKNLAMFAGYMEDGDYEMFNYVLNKKHIEVIGNIYNKWITNDATKKD